MNDPLDCLIDSSRKHLKAYLHKRTKREQARFVWRYYHDVDPKTGVFCRRQWFSRPPEPFVQKRDTPPTDVPPQKWYPALQDADYAYYRDGTPTDSDEGKARNKRNTRHLKKLMALVGEVRTRGVSMQPPPWDWETASEPVAHVDVDPEPVELVEVDEEMEIPF